MQEAGWCRSIAGLGSVDDDRVTWQPVERHHYLVSAHHHRPNERSAALVLNDEGFLSISRHRMPRGQWCLLTSALRATGGNVRGIERCQTALVGKDSRNGRLSIDA
jgi:hypothetical protein